MKEEIEKRLVDVRAVITALDGKQARSQSGMVADAFYDELLRLRDVEVLLAKLLSQRG